MATQKKKLKYGFKSFFEPTPKNLKRLGDSLLAISVFAGGFTMIEFGKVAGFIVFGIGGIGKFLSTFFSEEDDDCNNDGPDYDFRGPRQF